MLTLLTVKILKLKKIMTVAANILKINRKIASLTDRHHPTLSVLPNKTANIIKQNWNQFLLVVKVTALKQQISKFYPQILSICSSICVEFADKKLIFAVFERWLLQWLLKLRETDSSFVL